MTDEKRRAFAYIIGTVNEKRSTGILFDHEQRSFHGYSGDVGSDRIYIFDHKRRGHISGNFRSELVTLFDQVTGKYCTLRISSDRFSGFDHETSKGFSGTARRGAVQFFDHEGYRNYTYSTGTG